MARIRPLSPLLFAALLVGCGGASPKLAPQASYAPPAEAADGVGITFGSSAGVPQQQYVGKVSTVFSQSAEKAPVNQEEPDAKGMTAPQVVYLGFLRLRVRRVLDAVDALTERVTAAGGYVESLSKAVMVVRVPAGDFDAAMARLAEVGEVVARRVKALDVTDQFQDLRGRLAVATETRDRLLALLEATQDTEERLRILQEIKRLTEQIESMQSRLTTLQNLVDYYTITVELEPVVAGQRVAQNRSPFIWVQRLRAHREMLDATDDVVLPVPAGFVRLESADGWQARAADTSVVRVSEVENEPRGDAAWWRQAVRHELEGRDENIAAEGTTGGLAWLIAREKDVDPRGWLVGVAAHGETLLVVEAFFPDADALERHRAAVLKALDGFRAK